MKKVVVLFIAILSFAAAAYAQSPLADFVSIMNKECPADLGDGMVMQSVTLEATEVVFTITVAETEVVEAMSDMPELMNSLGGMMIGSMANDESMHMILSMMVQEKKNLVMRFKAPGTTKVATMTIKYSALAKQL